MDRILKTIIFIGVLVISMSCRNEVKDFEEYAGSRFPLTDSDEGNSGRYTDTDIWHRHHSSVYKILAIGNSFTNNASNYLPWFANRLDGDSICIARIMKRGCSLEEHWSSHCIGSNDYDFQYSDKDGWTLSDIKTLDEALTALDWDVIVIQQASVYSGNYSSFQPWLDNLVRLFHETNPSAKIAWHSTWAYRKGTDHPWFNKYDRDPDKMYDAIMNASDLACENMDYRIPSGTLVKRLREEYPEVEDQFSEDGLHITSGFASYALSVLWYEMLLRPITGNSSINPPYYHIDVRGKDLSKVNDIISELMGYSDSGESNSVDMVYQ